MIIPDEQEFLRLDLVGQTSIVRLSPMIKITIHYSPTSLTPGVRLGSILVHLLQLQSHHLQR